MARIDQQLIIPVINNEDNTIALINPSKSIDIRMKLRQVDANGVASDVQFAYSLDDEDNVFTALFDDNDIDFEIQFDNRTTDKRRMAFTMTYGKDYKFIAYKGLSKLRALGDSGHHLRFLSPNKSMANDFVDLGQQEKIRRSRIRFAFEAEKERLKIDDNQKMTIKVQTLHQKIIELKISPNDMISDINDMIYESEGIHQYMQRLLMDDKELEEDKSVSDYGIEEGMTIHVIVKPRSGQWGGGLPVTVPLGPRGAFGFGHKRCQQLSRSHKEFIADENIQFKPFSIELRIK